MVAKLRGILHVKKIGHTGTLDPMAEGVLVVLTEKDTKRQAEFMKMQKEYVTEVALGLESDSYDLETALRRRPGDAKFTEPKVGKFLQTVPSYSAVKLQGKRLYKLARSGAVANEELPKKEVELFELEKLKTEKRDFGEFKGITVVSYRVVCSSGFYVRSMAHDMGGVMVSLVRTRIGEFRLENSKKLKDILSAL